MSLTVLLKLIAIFAVVGLGWTAGRMRWLGEGDAARTLSMAAFHLFAPALLFRTTSRIDLSAMPWSLLLAFFVPTLGFLLGAYLIERRRRLTGADPALAGLPAGPSVRAITMTFGNTVQLGIPVAAALFGEAGLSLHLTIVSLHALFILILATALVETDLAHMQAHEQGMRPRLGPTLLATARATIIHPVVLPVLAGLAWNAAGLTLPTLVDETLLMLSQAVVPVCLVIIGISLERHGLKGAWRGAARIGIAKMVVLPAIVLVAGRWGAGLHGTALATLVMCAALPPGSNALLFAQRYRALEGEVSAATVISTFAFVLVAPLWLTVLGLIG